MSEIILKCVYAQLPQSFTSQVFSRFVNQIHLIIFSLDFTFKINISFNDIANAFLFLLNDLGLLFTGPAIHCNLEFGFADANHHHASCMLRQESFVFGYFSPFVEASSRSFGIGNFD